MSETATINRSNVEDIISLSPLQRGMLFHYLRKPESKAYMAQLILSLDGNIDMGILREACRIVAGNNEMLRTVFRWAGLQNPIQIVLKDYEIPFCAYDFSTGFNTDIEKQVERIKRNIWAKQINICIHPIEIVICKVNAGRFEMFINWHHIVYDGWSNAVFIRELFLTYDNLVKGITPQSERKSRYKDFIRWCGEQDEQQQENYWKAYFRDFTVKTPLPVDRDKKAGVSAESECAYFSIPEVLLKNINDFISKKSITLAVLMYCAWAILLYKYLGVRDIVYGVTVSGRNVDIDGIENMIGLFINTLPLRVTINEETQIADIIRQINQCKKSWVPFESTDLAKVKKCSDIDVKESLFDSIVVVENYPLMLEKWLCGNGTEFVVKSYEMLEKTEYSLVLAVLLPHNNSLTLQYDTKQFSIGFIEKLAEYYLHIIDKIITGFDKPVSMVELLLEKEKRKMLLEIEELQGAIDINFEF